MRSEDFATRLVAASYYAFELARQSVIDELPPSFRYLIVFNQSNDGNREDDEVIYPEDDGRFEIDLDRSQALDLLVRQERVPQWVDISVAAVDNDHTLIKLLCCGRYHHLEERLYYFIEGTQPFGIKSPDFPPRYAEGTRFQLPAKEKILVLLRKYAVARKKKG